MRNVNVYVRELEHGEFELTHQGIAIAEDGSLVDGQHRLLAIEKSGISARMAVIFNAPRSSKIDRGRNRRDQDALYMSGKITKDNSAYKRITFPLSRLIASRNVSDHISNNLTPDNRLAIYNKFKSLIDPVVEIIGHYKHGNKGTHGAAVIYAMCCALNCGVSIKTLDKWYKILTTGDFYDDGNHDITKAGRSVLLFRRYIEESGANMSNGSKKMEEVIKKAMSSIYHFDAKEPITKLYGSDYYGELLLDIEDIYK